MKKFFPWILAAIFVVLIAVGVVGIRMIDRESEQEVSAVEQNGVITQTASAAEAPTGLGNAPRVAGEKKIKVSMPANVTSQMKEYTGFKVSFNADNRTPNWVAWELLGAETDGPQSRSNKFWQDDDVDGCPQTRDYTRSGYDRGHMCPAADQKWSEQAMTDCFALTNIVPQDNSLNTGAWSTLEGKERNWARRDSAIWIVAGPIYESGDNIRIGDAGVRVPSAFFKILIAPFLKEPRGIAFVYPNMHAPGNMENYVMKIRDVEQLTGYDFFSDLPQDFQDKIETVSSFREWNGRY